MVRRGRAASAVLARAPWWLCLALGLLLGAQVPRVLRAVPGHIIRVALGAQGYAALRGGGAPAFTRVAVAPPSCGRAAPASPSPSGVRVHLLLAVTGFADVLNVSLPANRAALGPALGSVFLLTAPDDAETLAVAAAHGADGRVEATVSDVWTAGGAVLNRAGALAHLHAAALAACGGPEDFFAIIDVDIALPPGFGGAPGGAVARVLAPAAAAAAAEGARGGPAARELADTLWGARRVIYPTRAEYELARAGGRPSPGPPPPPGQGGDAAFLGYFQIFHASAPHRYAPWSRDVAESDRAFARAFSRHAALPGVEVAHLGVPGVNWHGRLTGRWRRR